MDVQQLVQEADRVCPACGTDRCARSHAWRYRKRVTDLSTGEVFTEVPILRVRFCDGSTTSLMPAELWRGRATVSSVLETVVHVLRDGVEAAAEWVGFASPTGASLVSARTLCRWRDAVERRLVGSGLAWLGPRLRLDWSERAPAARQLERLLDRLEEAVLLAFRAATGRAVIDKPVRPATDRDSRSGARRVPGRLAPAPPPDPPSEIRPRRTPWRPPRRGPPRRTGGDL